MEILIPKDKLLEQFIAYSYLNNSSNRIQSSIYDIIDLKLSSQFSYNRECYELIVPFLLCVEDCLAQFIPFYNDIQDSVREDLRTGISERLMLIVSRCVELECRIESFSSSSSLSRILGIPNRQNQSSGWSHADRSNLIFSKYPPLKHILSIVSSEWVHNIILLFTRINNDKDLLNTIFSDINIKDLDGIQTQLSDPHNDGESVISLSFSSSKKIIYKPRSLKVDIEFYNFLSWINQIDQNLSFLTPETIDCHKYGWQEFISHSECITQEGIKKFYIRSGALLAVLYILSGSDCHYQNIIANGEYPVVIDLETLMSPLIMHQSFRDSLGTPQWRNNHLLESVLSVGMLPRWEVSPHGELHDSSGLCGTDIQNEEATQLYGRESFRACNIPVLDGKKIDANLYKSDICSGFCRMYNLLFERQSDLLNSHGPLAHFTNKEVRFLLRPTRIYQQVLWKSLHPNQLKLESNRNAIIDELKNPLLREDAGKVFLPLFQHEKDILNRCNIPKFTTISDKMGLIDPYIAPLTDCTITTGFDRAKQKIVSMSAYDLDKQIRLIDLSFTAKIESSACVDSEQITYNAEPYIRYNRDDTIIEDFILQQIEKIGKKVLDSAIPGANKEYSWAGLHYHQGAGYCQIDMLPATLYDGTAGIGLFFAAASSFYRNNVFREAAYRTLKPLFNMARQPYELMPGIGTPYAVSMASGISGILYALTHAGIFLRDETFIELASSIVDDVILDILETDLNLDILNGVSGLALSLLFMSGHINNKSVLLAIYKCGDILIKSRVQPQNGYYAWQDRNGNFLTGFSHGAAGISYVLAKLYDKTGDSRFIEASKYGIAYENSLFSQSEGNWPDLRVSNPSQGEARYAVAWCHGAPGIALGRAGCQRHMEDSRILNDIHFAASTTFQAPPSHLDTLCCGNFGRVGSIFDAALIINDTILMQQAKDRLISITNEAQSRNYFRLFLGAKSDDLSPGLFKGISGIGYQLLRLIEPNSIPSLLLFS